MLSLTTACPFGGPPPSPTLSQCDWVKVIVTDPADVLTRPTKEQIVAHRYKVECFCHHLEASCLKTR